MKFLKERKKGAIRLVSYKYIHILCVECLYILISLIAKMKIL